MRISNILTMFLLSGTVLSLPAEDSIRVTGSVSDGSNGLSQAFVRLKGAQLSVETATTGDFELLLASSGTAARPRSGSFAEAPELVHRAGRVFFHSSRRRHEARISLYDLQGKQPASVVILHPAPAARVDLGAHLLPGRADGNFVVAVSIDGRRTVARLLVVDGKVAALHGPALSAPQPATRRRAEAPEPVDTLIINRLGYYPRRIPLDSYIADFSGPDAVVLEKSPLPCIDAGGLLLGFVNEYAFRWSDAGSGHCIDGSFWHPGLASAPGFKPVGSYGRRGGNPTAGEYVIVLKESDSSGALAAPVDYTEVWNDKGSGSNNDGSFWRPVPPPGYVALGAVAQSGYGKPALDDVVCVREDLTTDGAIGSGIWVYGGTICAGDADAMKGSPGSFHACRITPVDAPTFGSFPITCGAMTTFVTGNSPGLPATTPELRCLNVKLPMVMDNAVPPTLPELSGLDEPPGETPPHFARVMMVPFSVISDTSANAAWQVANTPFYRVERYQYYRKLFYMINNGSSDWPWSEAITTGITQEQSRRFWHTTGISVTANAGFEFKGFSAGVSVTVSEEFGYESSSSISIYESKTVTKTATVPPHHIGALWQKNDLVLMKRCNNEGDCRTVGAETVPLESYYYDETPVP